MSSLSIRRVCPTIFLTGPEEHLRQRVLLTVANGGPAISARVRVELPGGAWEECSLAPLPPGESTHDLYFEALEQPARVMFTLLASAEVCDRREVLWQPPRRWRVHLVQRSHHDVGYTDLASHVLRQHDEFLGSVIEMAAATRHFPDDAQFRVVVEQAWSLDHFLRHAPAERRARMLALLRSGHVELTALFGNLTTEICGSESLVRALYHASRIRRAHGIPILTAEHNDVPGMSWGLCQILTEAGIRLFCPALPRYYSWGSADQQLPSFWDDARLFPQGQPGAFWWEAPSGKRVLLYDNFGVGGDVRPALPGLAERLAELAERGYPFSAIRWPVAGGARDNAPYVEGYAHTAREWNERWTYPRLICSTNARFYADFAREIPDDLPVFRGELPGQDYPIGATSTAAGTAVSRATHAGLQAAETLAAVATAATGATYPAERLFAAYEDVLWYDEHTWGHHFPCGPTAAAAELEKSVHAHRAAALTHDVLNQAMARLADRVCLEGDGFHLVVFNPLPYARTGPVSTPMREFDNCGSTLVPVDDKEGSYLRGVLLGDRWHAHPPADLVAGQFDLIEVATGEVVPYQLVEVTAPDETVPYAPQRAGLGHGSRRYGLFEIPTGLRRDLRFVATDVPACGYRTYRLAPREAPPTPSPGPVVRRTPAVMELENEFYRVRLCGESGRFLSILDKELGWELLDPEAPHAFGDLLVRGPLGDEFRPGPARVEQGASGAVCASVHRTGSAHGHPGIRQTVTLYRGLKRIDFAVRVLKDPTPLLDAHLAFPFRVEDARFRYEGALSVMTPIHDFLPGSYSDTLAVQSWVRAGNDERSVVWCSRDAPMVSLGGLWPGYVSPAHRCVVGERAAHPPLTPEALRQGWIYSNLFANNFGTNFSVSQCGSLLFRYAFTSCRGEVADADAARFGREVALPLETIFTEGGKAPTLPPVAGFLRLEGDGVTLLACKRAEDDRGWILRLWNVTAAPTTAQVCFGLGPIRGVALTSIVEEDQGEALPVERDRFAVPLPPRGVVTVRVW